MNEKSIKSALNIISRLKEISGYNLSSRSDTIFERLSSLDDEALRLSMEFINRFECTPMIEFRRIDALIIGELLSFWQCKLDELYKEESDTVL